MSKKSICIIPARGGSKRIPRKNIKDFLGKPIIAYSIESALNSGLFSEIMVSTDDQEIAEVAEKYGASVPFLRSKKNSDDFATTLDVIFEVLKELRKDGGLYDEICCIYPTAPFISSEKLKNAKELLEIKEFDCVLPVMQYSFPIQRSVTINADSKMTLLFPEHLNSRSQDLEKIYHDAGQFYFFKIEKILEKKALWTDNTGVIEINELEGQDIDNETDWKLAELKYKLLKDEISD
jgi:N-acylneuraminate cytidylyltransferase